MSLSLRVACLIPIFICFATVARAVPVITAGASTPVGADFKPAYGNDGSILFNTTAAGTGSGNFTFLTNIVTQSTAGSTNVITTPSYVSSINGIAGGFFSVAGFGYPNITAGLEAGLSGVQGATGGDLFRFTIGAGAPSTIMFGILTNYSATADQPVSVSLTSGVATATDTVSTTGFFAKNNLFTITGAIAGDIFTVSAINNASSNGYIAGATFDSVPEPSSCALLALGLVGIWTKTSRGNRKSGA